MTTFSQECPNSLFPLVSIGIPTYNRVYSLRKTIESAISQDYPNLELVISDNASTDDTQALCQEVCQQDNRIRYIRQSSNIGPTANFMEVLKHAQGEFFMWLGDDDWLDASYVSQCVKVLVAQPDFYLVGGKARYFHKGQFLYEGVELNLLQDFGKERLLSYYQQVTDNGIFYGIMRRSYLASLDLRNVMGGDWLLIASIAFTGKILTLDNIFVNRSVQEINVEIYFQKIALSLGLSNFSAKNPHLVIAAYIFQDIVCLSAVYSSLSRVERFHLAYQSSRIIMERFNYIKKYNINSVLRKLVKSGLKKYLPIKLFVKVKNVYKNYQ